MREHVREALSGQPDPKYLREKADAGWRMVAIEWDRDVEGKQPAQQKRLEEPPFGLRVSGDCQNLEEDPSEMQVLAQLLEMIVQDLTLPRMAEALNQKGLRTRHGAPWSPVSVFQILPRLIEAGPRIFRDEEWVARRKNISAVVWNS